MLKNAVQTSLPLRVSASPRDNSHLLFPGSAWERPPPLRFITSLFFFLFLRLAFFHFRRRHARVGRQIQTSPARSRRSDKQSTTVHRRSCICHNQFLSSVAYADQGQLGWRGRFLLFSVPYPDREHSILKLEHNH